MAPPGELPKSLYRFSEQQLSTLRYKPPCNLRHNTGAVKTGELQRLGALPWNTRNGMGRPGHTTHGR